VPVGWSPAIASWTAVRLNREVHGYEQALLVDSEIASHALGFW